jgi:energy-converting hydrogenase Eha subunit B
MTSRRDILVAIVAAGGIYLGLAGLVAEYPSLAPTYAGLIGAFVAVAILDAFDDDPIAAREFQQYGVVVTAIARQTLRRLDEREQHRALDDAERELMDVLELDVEFDREGLLAQVATEPDVDVEASDD